MNDICSTDMGLQMSRAEILSSYLHEGIMREYAAFFWLYMKNIAHVTQKSNRKLHPYFDPGPRFTIHSTKTVKLHEIEKFERFNWMIKSIPT